MSPVLATLLKYVGCLLLAVLALGGCGLVVARARDAIAARDPILMRRTEIAARTKGDARKFWRRQPEISSDTEETGSADSGTALPVQDQTGGES